MGNTITSINNSSEILEWDLPLKLPSLNKKKVYQITI